LIAAPVLVHYQFGQSLMTDIALSGAALLLILVTAWAIHKSRKAAEFMAPIDEEAVETVTN